MRGAQMTHQVAPAHRAVLLTVALVMMTYAAPAHADLNIDCSVIQETGYDGPSSPFPLEVITINGILVERELAKAFVALHEAAHRDGVNVALVSGFRTMSSQQYLYNCYVNRSGPGQCPSGCSSCNIAAVPGTSKHQLGTAIDISTNGGTNAAYSWMKAHGYSFGFVDTFNPPEPWHWVYVHPGIYDDPCGGDQSTESQAVCTPSPVTGAENEVFKDMPPGAFGKREAELIQAAGITNGCAPDLFCPDCGATRAMMVTFLIRALGIDVSGYTTSRFSDVAVGTWYHPYVEAAADLGMTNGCSPTEFCPDDVTTRAQVAKFIIEAIAAPLATPATPSFTDVDPAHWSYPYIETMKALCITTGCSPTTYCPSDPVTRAQAAVFLARAFDLQNTNTCIERCDAAACAASSFCENWGACDNDAGACVETGEQTRACHTFACTGPPLQASCAQSTSTKTQACTGNIAPSCGGSDASDIAAPADTSQPDIDSNASDTSGADTPADGDTSGSADTTSTLGDVPAPHFDASRDGGDAGGRGARSIESGCGCTVVGASSQHLPLASWLFLGLLFVGLARRQR